MTSNQAPWRSSPKNGSANDSEAGSTILSSNREEVFMSGALQDSKDSRNPRAASQGSDGSDSPMSSTERSPLEAPEMALSLANVALSEHEEAVATALPDSIDGDSDVSSSLRSPRKRSSLRDLELAPSPALTASPENQEAISNASPNSTDGGSGQESPNYPNHSTGQVVGQNLQSVPSPKPYMSTIKTLSSHLPHLRNVQKHSLRESAKVVCYDYADDALASVLAFSKSRRSSGLQTTDGMSLDQYLRYTPPDNVQLRLIVASDLSTALIECLGTVFSMSPEVYEEHLVNSGWRNGTYDDEEPDTWVTRDMKKSHMSIKWYRPVKRTQQPFSTAERKEFLNSGTLPFLWTEVLLNEHGKPHDVEHKSTPRINILRRDWDMNTDADAAISVTSFAAWEERATIWSRQYSNIRLVVLLLDPLPISRDAMKGAAEALQSLGLDRIDRIEEPKGANKDQARKKAPKSSTTARSTKELANPSTFFRSWRKADQSFFIRSIGRSLIGKPQRPQNSSSDGGPTTKRPEASQGTGDLESGQSGIGNREMRVSGLSSWLSLLLGRSERKTKKLDRDEVLDPSREKMVWRLLPTDRCMFEGLYPRGPVVDYDKLMDPSNMDLRDGYLDLTKSTAKTFEEWLYHSNGRRSNNVGPAPHLRYLFEIVRNDTMNTLRHMEFSLREIGQHILDDSLIQERLVHWRHLLERFGTELQQLEDSLRRFAVFIHASEYPHQVNVECPGPDSSPIENLLEDSVSRINFVRRLTTRSHKSLMANMSIVESKRGIAEAESVTKLTELAFFFIPLTFSASIFSMQVKELNASRTSIAAFFILAIIITTASYALRLVIRSQKVIRGQRELLKNIRNDRGLALGVPVPTGLFIAWISRWVWGRFGILTIIVTFEVALLVTLTAVLWTRELNHAFKILLTILLLTFILAASFVTGKAMLYVDGRSLRVRRDIFNPGRKAAERPKQTPFTITQSLTEIFPWLLSPSFLIGLAATVVAAGPSAALWTSQLTIGIKVGVTIVLGMLYICTIVYLALRAIKNRKPPVATEDESD